MIPLAERDQNKVYIISIHDSSISTATNNINKINMIPYSFNKLGINYNYKSSYITNTDIEVLRAFRDANPNSLLPSIWSDNIDPFQWPRLYWDNTKCINLQLYDCSISNAAYYVNQLINLTNINLENNLLTGDFRANNLNNVTSINIRRNNITSVDFSNNAALIAVDLDLNNISTLDFSKNPLIKIIFAHSNNISSINLANCYSLENIIIGFNKLTSLDISNRPNLWQVQCESNLISSLNFLGSSKLENLYANNNALTSLNITNLTLLKRIECQNNQLASIPSLTSKGLITNADFRHNNMPLSETNRLITLGFDSSSVLPQNI